MAAAAAEGGSILRWADDDVMFFISRLWISSTKQLIILASELRRLLMELDSSDLSFSFSWNMKESKTYHQLTFL